MKNLYPTRQHLITTGFIVGILLTTTLFSVVKAQTFRPFDANTTALYTTAPDAGATSGLTFTETVIVNGDSVFHPLKTFKTEDINNMVTPDQDCEASFWSSGGECHPQNVPLWLGAEMRKTAPETYQYSTAAGEQMTFDFGIAPGDSALVYENENFELYLIGEGQSVGSFLDMEQPIAQFRLAHLHASGGSADSPLHNAPIKLGAQLGAIHFMRIDSFPQIMQPIEMVGHAGTESGLYAIYHEDIYDFSEGDFFQFKDEQSVYAPGTGYTEYRNLTVLSRSETENTISYTFLEESARLQNTGAHVDGIWVPDVDTIFASQNTTLEVTKGEVLAQLPFESHDPDLGYRFRSLRYVETECGLNWQFSEQNSTWFQCSSDSIQCYGNTLNVAPGEGYTISGPFIYQPGYGMTFSRTGWQVVSSSANTLTTSLEYSLKNGEACGSQWVLSTTAAERNRNDLRIFPNPTSSFVRLDLPGSTLSRATFYDMQGRQVLDVQLNASDAAIDVSTLPKGMYLLRAGGQNGAVYVNKLVAE